MFFMNRYRSGLIVLLIFAISTAVFGEGMMETEPEISSAPAAESLPVTSVTLFTAGLAQIVHETKVDGDEVIILPVEPKDINDLLKSLNIKDLDGGFVDVVNFDSSDPLSASLADFRLNPSGPPAIRDFLLRTQGESVTVKSGYNTHSGLIFSIEETQSENGTETILNLMNDGTITPANITSLDELKFADPLLQTELSTALELIAGARLKTVRKLKISCRGEGERIIRISYMRAVPLWKTSYRIILDEEGIPRLEGWAIVQNTSAKSWKDISLSFVAGQPNAFTMDLSTPRYVTRKNVDISTAAPLGPTTYEKAAPQLQLSRSRAYSEAPAMSSMADDMYTYKEEAYAPPTVTVQAAGVREGNFYRYDIKHKVTVDARSSAMIPIVSEEEAGDSLGIYDPSFDMVFKGIRLKNSTDAHWAAGPVTVSEGRVYGGDALMPEMLPGTSRLLTYAQHGTLEITKTMNSEPQRITALKISNGLLFRTNKINRLTEYRAAGEEKELLIIHPKESGWNLTGSPEIAEENQSEYRFTVTEWAEPIEVKEEYFISREFSLSNFRQSDIDIYLSWSGTTDVMKQALGEIAELRVEVENIRTTINSLNSRLSRIERDQSRVRENMKVLDKESDLFRQYTETFVAQEEEIKKLDTEISARQKELTAAEKTLRDYINSLEL